MSVQPLGLHHVTAIATDPQRNVEFYTQHLGLRLVKQTVNFDAPEVYHLYYGDEAGRPGTLLTFFPWGGVPAGRRGTGQATTTSFSVPEASLGYWKQRLELHGVAVREAVTRMEEDALSFYDPDGLLIELVAHVGASTGSGWAGSDVPAEHAIRGLHSVTFCEDGTEVTASLLTETLGFRLVDESADRLRFDVGEGGPGARVDVVAQPGGPRGIVAGGTVHHVAWRAPDRDAETEWRKHIIEAGVAVTPIINRCYFESIYFREPGGVLLEIATDPPGFTIDEPLLELGRRLRLPPWLEPDREQIERGLPALDLPAVVAKGS
jgi:glyoxalase family protein